MFCMRLAIFGDGLQVLDHPNSNFCDHWNTKRRPISTNAADIVLIDSVHVDVDDLGLNENEHIHTHKYLATTLCANVKLAAQSQTIPFHESLSVNRRHAMYGLCKFYGISSHRIRMPKIAQ